MIGSLWEAVYIDVTRVPIYKISYDCLTIMSKLRSTYDGRLIYYEKC